jgi:hypothetical protein
VKQTVASDFAESGLKAVASLEIAAQCSVLGACCVG